MMSMIKLEYHKYKETSELMLNKKEVIYLILSIAISIFSYLFMTKFKALLLITFTISIYIWSILKNRKHICIVKRLFDIYRVIFTICVSILLSIFSVILYNGNRKKEVKLLNDVNCILVLGSSLENNEMSNILKMRLDKALEYHSLNENINIIVSGGVTDNSSISEAEVMKEYLVSMGIEESKVYLEDKARNTYENLLFSSTMLKDINANKDILIVTSDFHITRALMISKSFGINSYGLSSDTPYNNLEYLIREVLAFIKDFIKCSINKII